ncbi:MAG: Hsp20/alpha crystallin family protein [Caulobacteraceae bacterium]
MVGRDPSDWMWDDALDLLARADRLHRALFQPAPSRERRPRWEPPVDVIETEESVVVIAALPGVAEDAIELAIEHGSLLIRGERSLPAEFARAAIHRLELPQGGFERRVPLPAGRYAEVRRRSWNGCLVVNLAKAK